MNYSSDTMLWVPWVCRGFAVGVVRVCCWDLTTLASQYAAGFIMSTLTYNKHDFMSEPMQEHTDDKATLQPYRQAYLGNAAAHGCNTNKQS